MIKIPIKIDEDNYIIVIKEEQHEYAARVFYYYKVYLYKGKYNIFKKPKYGESFNWKDYKYDLISMVNKVIEEYYKQYKAIKDLKECEWNRSID